MLFEKGFFFCLSTVPVQSLFLLKISLIDSHLKELFFASKWTSVFIRNGNSPVWVSADSIQLF